MSWGCAHIYSISLSLAYGRNRILSTRPDLESVINNIVITKALVMKSSFLMKAGSLGS